MKKVLLTLTSVAALTTAASANKTSACGNPCKQKEAVTEAAPAATVAAPHNFRSGYVLGANAGASYKRFKGTENLNFTVAATNIAGKTSRSGHTWSPMFEINGGYRHAFQNNWLVGGELAVAVDRNRMSSKNKINSRAADGSETSQSSVSLRENYSVTPAFMVGRVICEKTMVFAKLGLAVSNQTLKVENKEAGGRPTVSKDKKTKFRYGITPTIGAEYALNNNWSATGAVSYTYFGKKSTNLKGAVAAAGIVTENLKHKISVRPSTVTLKAGVLYRF